jgi:phytoene dehydrogenase-like protein
MISLELELEAALRGFHLRQDGVKRAVPPRALLSGLAMMRRPAPIDMDLQRWVADRKGTETAALVDGVSGVLTFDHDPGRLSAAFVAPKTRRLLMTLPPVTRYPLGGGNTLIARLAAYAEDQGVRITTGVRVDDLPPPPVIVAVEPRAARDLLRDDALGHVGTETALMDVGLEGTSQGKTFNLIDLDEAGFAERFTAVDPSLAPPGRTLIQALTGRRRGASLAQAVARLESLLDVGWPTWRDREVWRRRSIVRRQVARSTSPGRRGKTGRLSIAVIGCGSWEIGSQRLATSLKSRRRVRKWRRQRRTKP